MNTQLESVLTGADYVRIRTGGTCHRVPPQEKTICEFSSSSRIRELIPLLSVVEDAWAPDCPCCGGPTIEFYKNKQLIAVFGLHHGNRVRWIGSQWPGDGFLLDGRGLANWLAEQGAPELKMEILAAEEQARNYQNCLQEWMQLLPKALQPYTQAISNGYFDLRYDVALKKVWPDRDDRLRWICQWYGKGCKLWQYGSPAENVPILLLAQYSTSSLVKALEDEEKTTDEMLVGAGLYFGSNGFLQRREGELKFLSMDLRKRILASVMKTGEEVFFNHMESVFLKDSNFGRSGR